MENLLPLLLHWPLGLQLFLISERVWVIFSLLSWRQLLLHSTIFPLCSCYSRSAANMGKLMASSQSVLKSVGSVWTRGKLLALLPEAPTVASPWPLSPFPPSTKKTLYHPISMQVWTSWYSGMVGGVQMERGSLSSEVVLGAFLCLPNEAQVCTFWCKKVLAYFKLSYSPHVWTSFVTSFWTISQKRSMKFETTSKFFWILF